MMKWLLYILLLLMGVCIGYTMHPKSVAPQYVTTIDTLRDTIRDSVPYPSSIVSLPPKAFFFDKIDTLRGDTIHDTAYIPIVQKEIRTKKYHAWISGYEPNLDSIDIFDNTIIKRIPVPANAKKWSIGLQSGYGITPRGLQPYIGIGIGIRIY